jgi:hypothetical protein
MREAENGPPAGGEEYRRGQNDNDIKSIALLLKNGKAAGFRPVRRLTPAGSR